MTMKLYSPKDFEVGSVYAYATESPYIVWSPFLVLSSLPAVFSGYRRVTILKLLSLDCSRHELWNTQDRQYAKLKL